MMKESIELLKSEMALLDEEIEEAEGFIRDCRARKALLKHIIDTVEKLPAMTN